MGVKLQGFEVGRPIVLNPGGANEETNIVVGFGSLKLQYPLQYEHSADEAVQQFKLEKVEPRVLTVDLKAEPINSTSRQSFGSFGSNPRNQYPQGQMKDSMDTL